MDPHLEIADPVNLRTNLIHSLQVKNFQFFLLFYSKKISGRRLLIGLEDQDRLQDVLLQPTAPLAL